MGSLYDFLQYVQLYFDTFLLWFPLIVSSVKFAMLDRCGSLPLPVSGCDFVLQTFSSVTNPSICAKILLGWFTKSKDIESLHIWPWGTCGPWKPNSSEVGMTSWEVAEEDITWFPISVSMASCFTMSSKQTSEPAGGDDGVEIG